MGRPSKFHFPVPGRKPRHQQQEYAVDTPVAESQTISKAERLLGTSGLGIPQTPSTTSSRSLRRPSVSSRPSYMSLTYSDMGTSRASDFDGMPRSPAFSDHPNSPRMRNFLQHPGSPHPIGNDDRAASANGNPSGARHVVPERSSSTLKAYYDARNSPWHISQQTSESSIRDRALHKGKPPVVHEQAGARADGRSLAEESSVWGNGSSVRTKKPSRLDFSRLFSKSSLGSLRDRTSQFAGDFQSVDLPTNGSVDFPIYAHTVHSDRYLPSGASFYSSPRSGKTNNFAQRPFAAARAGIASPQSLPETSDYVGTRYLSKRRSKGNRNWFDSLPELEDEEDEYGEQEEEREEVEMPTPTLKADMSRLESGKAKVLDLTRQSPPLEDDVPELILSSRQHRAPVPETLLEPKSSLRRKGRKAPVRSRDKKFSQSNLGEDSILSTSEEDSSDEQLPETRDSIAVSDLDEGSILIGRAHTLDMKARNSDTGRPSTGSRRPSLSSSLKSTGTTRSRQSSSTYIASQAQFVRRPSAIAEDVDESSGKSGSSPDSTRTAPQAEAHKLMAVTAEEEALLESIRRKRAAMAKHGFVQGYKVDLKRPSTSDGLPASDSTKRKSSIRSSNSILPTQSTRTSSVTTPRSADSEGRMLSLLDSFPVAYNQRSSLTLSARTSLQSPPPAEALPAPPPVPSSVSSPTDSRPHDRRYSSVSGGSSGKRVVRRTSSRLSRKTPSIASLESRVSSATKHTTSTQSAPAMPPPLQPLPRAPTAEAPPPEPKGTPAAPTPAAPAEVPSENAGQAQSLAAQLQPSHSPAPSSGSHVSPLPSPMTPQASRDSAEVVIKPAISSRGSGNSSDGAIDRHSAVSADKAEKTIAAHHDPNRDSLPTALVVPTYEQLRQRTNYTLASILTSPLDLLTYAASVDEDGEPDALAAKLSGEVITEEEGQSPQLYRLQHHSSMLPPSRRDFSKLAVDVRLAAAAHSPAILNSPARSPMSAASGSSSTTTTPTSCNHHQHHHACGEHKRASMFGMSRCSVSEDVLAAWGELGGWRAA